MTNKHKHAEMIKAKADNMDLVVFCENINNKEWWECRADFPFNNHQNFFLCLPKHKDTCLYWLNGGEIEYKSKEYWRSSKSWPDYVVSEFGAINYFTSEYSEVRVKPKKEKRWIALMTDKRLCSNVLFESLNEAQCIASGAKHYQEIEVMV